MMPNPIYEVENPQIPSLSRPVLRENGLNGAGCRLERMVHGSDREVRSVADGPAWWDLASSRLSDLEDRMVNASQKLKDPIASVIA